MDLQTLYCQNEKLVPKLILATGRLAAGKSTRGKRVKQMMNNASLIKRGVVVIWILFGVLS